MSKSSKVILDLWDDEPINSVKSTYETNIFAEPSAEYSVSNETNLDQSTYKTQNRSEQDTPLVNPMPSVSVYTPTNQLVLNQLHRQQKQTVPIQPAKPIEEEVHNPKELKTSEDILRNLPSTKPAPQVMSESSIQTTDREVTQIATLDPNDDFMSNSMEVSSDFNSVNKLNETWLDSESSDYKKPLQEVSTFTNTNDFLDPPPSGYSQQNLQNLITNDWQEEILHNHQHQQYSRLRKEYESSKAQEQTFSKSDFTQSPFFNSVSQKDQLAVNNELPGLFINQQPSNQEYNQASPTPASLESFAPPSLLSSTPSSSEFGPTTSVKSLDPNVKLHDSSSKQSSISSSQTNKIHDLPTAQELLAELFPSDRPIQINLEEIAVEDLPTMPPLNQLESHLNEQSIHPKSPSPLDHSSVKQPLSSEEFEDYIEPLSFTLPPRLEPPIYSSETIGEDTSLSSLGFRSDIGMNSKVFQNQSNKNLLKSTDITNHELQDYHPALLLSENSFKRRQKMSRVLVQGVERYMSGQVSFSPLMGIATLVFSKVYPIEIALSTELLNTMLADVDQDVNQLINDSSVEQVNQAPETDGVSGNTKYNKEHEEYLATVEFQTLLSGSSSVQAPKDERNDIDENEVNGWDLEQHLNPTLNRGSILKKINQKKKPPRLIQPLERSSSTKPDSQSSEDSQGSSLEREKSNSSLTISSDNEQYLASQAPENESIQNSTTSNNTTEVNEQKISVGQEGSTTSDSKPSSPRPSGHPSVKVRLWGLKP